MRLCLNCGHIFANSTWDCPLCGYKPEIKMGIPSFAPELSSDSGFKDAYFHELVELEARNFWFRSRNKLIIWAFERYFPAAKNLLEIGCGTGFILAGLKAAHPDLKLSGSEISCAGLKYASDRIPEADFFQMDARTIPFVNEFDTLGAFDVLEHIEEDEVALSQMYRAIRPGGGILLTVPQHEFLWSYTDEHACHKRRYEVQDLVTKVTTAGFRVERISSFVSLLLPIMLASRTLKPAAGIKSDPLAELRISGIINSILEAIMGIERLTIQAGLNFPAGGSLLLVARKES